MTTFVRRGSRVYIDRDRRSGKWVAHWVETELLSDPETGKKAPKRKYRKEGGFATERDARHFLRSVTTAPESSTWVACWTALDTATGKTRQHEKGGFPTRKAAQDYLVDVGKKVKDRQWRPEPPKDLTVDKLFDLWLAALELGGETRSSTLATYEATARGWVRPHIGPVPVANLSRTVVRDLVATLRSPAGSRLGRGPLSDRSVRHAVSVLTAATRWAKANDVIGLDPLEGVERPPAKLRSTASNAWTEEEARKFLDTADEDRLAAAWNLLLTRGLRRSELAALQWEDVKWDASTIDIRRARVVVKGSVVEGEPKTAESRRSIPLDPLLAGKLRTHHNRQAAEQLACEAWTDTGYVFTDELGRPLNPRMLSLRFGQLARKAGVRVLRLHDGRHSAATMMLASHPLHKVSHMLGHSKPSVTLDIYSHVLPRDLEAVGAEMSARLGLGGRGESAVSFCDLLRALVAAQHETDSDEIDQALKEVLDERRRGVAPVTSLPAAAGSGKRP